MRETLKRWAKIVAIFLYAFVVIIASSGAMNYGHTTDQNIYMVMGVINLLLGGYSAYRAWKQGGL